MSQEQFLNVIDRDEAERMHRESERPMPSLADELAEVTHQLEQLQTRLALLRCRAEEQASAQY